MKRMFVIGVVALFALACSPVFANAKSMAQGRDQAITGCLQNGSSAGQYQLVAQDGNTWNVKAGEYVDLSSYVNHTVTVAGPETRSHNSKNKVGHLTALDVAVDSQSCQQ
jgi:hypothetical protein